MKKTVFKIVLLLSCFYSSAQETFKLYDNFTFENVTYELNVAIDKVNKSYTLQILNNDEVDQKSVKLIGNYDESLFLSTLSELMTKIINEKNDDSTTPIKFSPSAELNAKWKVSYDRLIKEINKYEVITELYDQLDIEYSGKISLNKTVKLRLINDDSNDVRPKGLVNNIKKIFTKKTNNQGQKSSIPATDTIASAELTKKEEYPMETINFEVEYASIRFFNNRVNTISVVGIVGDETTPRTLTNNIFAIPFRFIIRDGSRLIVSYKDNDYAMEWNDLLDYKPEGTEYNYSVKNKNYKLQPKEEVKVESRNLFDYFTAIIFSDFLGLNSNGNNSLLMAEGRVIIPLALVNDSQRYGPNYFEAYLNASLYNGQEEGSSFVEWRDPALSAGVVTKINTFEFFKKRNIETGLNLGIYAFEWRGISSTFTFDYGFQFYRSKLRYIKDTANNFDDFQVYSIGHGPKLKIEIRPQVNFGADFNVGLMGFNYNGLNKATDYNGDFKKDVLIKNTTLYNGMFVVTNLYTKLNDKETNNGLYFRLGVNYDFYSYDVSPQIMVGYATNLTSFINKFKKKDEVTTP